MFLFSDVVNNIYSHWKAACAENTVNTLVFNVLFLKESSLGCPGEGLASQFGRCLVIAALLFVVSGDAEIVSNFVGNFDDALGGPRLR